MPYHCNKSLLTCEVNALNQIWNDGDCSFSDTYIATEVGILTEGRGLIATTGRNIAGYSISDMIKGTLKQHRVLFQQYLVQYSAMEQERV